MYFKWRYNLFVKINLEFLPLLSVWVVLVIFELVGDWFPPTLTIVTPPDIWFTRELKKKIMDG